jgi:hypothetical protein
MRSLRLAFFAGLLAVAAVAPVQAGPVQHGTALKKISITSAPEGAFTATGRLLCPAGQASTPFVTVSRTYPDGSLDLMVEKRFTCDDGSGTFELVIHVRLKFVSPGNFENNFRWLITGGTGQYENLEGFGTGFGTARDGELIDVYAGRLGEVR